MRRKLIVGSVVIVLCLGALATYLLFHLDPIIEGLRPQLLGTISKAVGTEVTAGEIKAKLLPQAVFEVRDLTTGNGTSAATVRSVRLFTSLLDLFGGAPAISEIVVDDVNLAFTRSKDGSLSVGGIKFGGKRTSPDENPPASSAKPAQANDAKQKPSDESGATARGAEPQKENAKDSEVAFQIKNFTVTNANVSLFDETVTPNSRIALSKINAYLKEVHADGTAKVDLSGHLFGADQPNLQLTGTAGNPLANQLLDLKFALKPLDLTAFSALAATYGAQLAGTSLSGPLDIVLSVKTRQDTPGADVSLLLNGKNAVLDHTALFHKEQGTELDFALALSSTLNDRLLLSAKNCSLRLGSNEIEIPWSIDTGNPLIDRDTTEIVTGEIRSKGIDLAELSKSIPLLSAYNLGGSVVPELKFKSEAKSPAYPNEAPAIPDGGEKPLSATPEVTGTVRLSQVSAKVTPPTNKETPGKESDEESASPPAIELTNLDGEVLFKQNDISAKNLTGSVSKQPFRLDLKATPSKEAGLLLPTFAAVLSSDRFDLLPFLTPAQAAKLKALSFDKLTLLSNYSVSNQSGSLSISADSANLAGIKSGALKLKLDIAPDKFVLAPSTLAVFGGSVTLNSTVGRAEAGPFSANVTASQLNLQQLMQASGSQSKVGLAGTLTSLRTDISGKTGSVSSSLTGPVALEASNGEITGFNLLSATLSKIDSIPGIQGALTGLIPEKFRPIASAEGTAFDQISVDGAFSAGRLNLNSLKLTHQLYTVTGKGWLIPGSDMELKVQLRLSSTLTTEMVAKQKTLKVLVDKVGSIVIPVVITRKDGKTLVLPDVSDLTKRGLQGAAKDAAGKALEKVAPGLGGASKLLDGLF